MSFDEMNWESTRCVLYVEHDARDDPAAPSALLMASREFRRSIHKSTPDAAGLIIHQFHIRRQDDEGEVATHPPTKGRGAAEPSTDMFTGYKISCDVCDRNYAPVPSSATNEPFNNFKKHVEGKLHISKGSAILAAVRAVPASMVLDDDASAAGLDAIAAAESHPKHSPLYDESERRDSGPFMPLPMASSKIEELVNGSAALDWVYAAGGESSSSSGSGTYNRRVTGAMCVFCNYFSKAGVDQSSIVSELTEHLNSKRHETLRQNRGGILNLFRPQATSPSSLLPPPPDLTRICWGYHKPELKVNGVLLKTRLLLNYPTEKLDWHPEPFTKLTLPRTESHPGLEINGTFRSENCSRYCVLLSGERRPDLSCGNCSSIGSAMSFRNALSRRANESADSSKTNFQVGPWLCVCVCFVYN
jgi:hypothetical protein